jgi:hypothetical protein
MRYLLPLCLMASLALAAPRDFLSSSEAAQIREAQEPNARLALYMNFARTRIDLVRDYIARYKTGNAALIHDALEDYAGILDAVDEVADDALSHGKQLAAGMDKVVATENDLLALLRQIDRSSPPGRQVYAFVLQQAIDATEDSLTTSREDLGERQLDVKARERQEMEAVKAAEAPVPAGKKDSKGSKTTPARKPPTLKRPDEQ